MNGIYHAFFDRVRKPENEKLRTRFSVFLVCTVISIIMWVMIKMSREYYLPVKFRVVAENLPKGKVLTGSPDSVINITVKGSGLELYSRIVMNKQNVVTVNLENLSLRQNGNQFSGFVRASKLIGSFSRQLPATMEITAVDPDTLHYYFENSFRKKVRVIPVVSLEFSRQYQLYDSLSILPDSIYISGRKENVDSIYHISTEKRVFEKLKNNVTARLALDVPKVRPPLSVSADSVTLHLTVEKFTEARVEVPVYLEPPDNELKYRTFPDKVSVICRVAMRDYNRLDPSLFTVYADISAHTEADHNRLPVEVGRIPSYVKVIRIEPPKIEYLILK